MTPIEELVQRCKQNDQRAWEEFLHHYVPIIKKMIKNILHKYGCSKWNDIDVIEDIWLKVFEKLYAQNGLELCVHFENFNGWLWTVANSKTSDYCRARKRTGPSIDPGDAEIDFDAFGMDSWFEQSQQDQEIMDELQNTLNKLSDIKNPKIMWTMRLCIMAEEPLTDAEIGTLVETFNYLDEKILKERVKQIQVRLHDKIDAKHRAGESADKIWHQIRNMEYKLKEIVPFMNVGKEEEIDEIERKIKQKENRYQELINEAQQFCRPSNSEIAELIGLPEKKVNHISSYLSRARNRLVAKEKKTFFLIK